MRDDSAMRSVSEEDIPNISRPASGVGCSLSKSAWFIYVTSASSNIVSFTHQPSDASFNRPLEMKFLQPRLSVPSLNLW